MLPPTAMPMVVLVATRMGEVSLAETRLVETNLVGTNMVDSRTQLLNQQVGDWVFCEQQALRPLQLAFAICGHVCHSLCTSNAAATMYSCCPHTICYSSGLCQHSMAEARHIVMLYAQFLYHDRISLHVPSQAVDVWDNCQGWNCNRSSTACHLCQHKLNYITKLDHRHC